MTKNKRILPILILAGIVIPVIFSSCTKYGKGFLSPYVQYAVNELDIIRGRAAVSYSLITDGSSVPMQVKWTHIYDSTGAIVDSLFSKTYSVAVWTAAYNATTDTTFASIVAKQSVAQLPPIVVNQSNGTIESNSGTLNLPLGTYTMDLQITNAAGNETLSKIMKIVILDGKTLETEPEQGSFRNQLAAVGNAAPAVSLFNALNSPFDSVVVTRFADSPNVLILKFTDRNGVPFNPATGEVTKRPNTGLNPVPPFLQNLQDYAPDTYNASDTAISVKFPLVPFPIASLGNGFNLYYNIKSPYIHIDSTSSWSSNTAGNYYQGTADSHYLGTYVDNKYNYYIRVPLRIWVPGSYEVSIKILDLTHQ